MSYILLYSYLIVSAIIVLMTFWSIHKLMRMDMTAKRLGVAGYFAILAVVSYFVRVMTESVTLFAWMTTVHLACIDFALLFYLIFVVRYTRFENNKIVCTLSKVFYGIVFVDVVALLINPFKNIVLDFGFRMPESLFSKIVYSAQHPLYYMHMALAYAMIVLILAVLFIRMRSVPNEFGRQYRYTIYALVFVFAFNFMTVFIFKNVRYLNFSVSAYCLMEIFMYIFAYKFGSYIMLNYFKESVFENMGQGIVLFDYNGEMVMRNTKAVRMLPTVKFDDRLDRVEFERSCNIGVNTERDVDMLSLQCSIILNSGSMPLRCDFRKMRNETGMLLGYLYIFADLGMETDALTGFHKLDGFKNFALENSSSFVLPMTAIVADLNNLSVANSVGGRNRGDRLLANFAKCLRSKFPKDSYFVRGEDAKLVILCYNITRKEIADNMAAVSTELGDGFLYAQELITDDKPNILNAIEMASKTLHQKKLMNHESKHSELLESLMKSQKECNPTVEIHAARLKKWCADLGPRLNLTDKQQSDLELLCMLYDIGKIGIPAEILKKPESLSREEWRVVQAHVEKGYQIAKSSKDFMGIADYIRHHHERWDGKGYPDGLNRESIPLLSRIISVLDAYDAMVSERSYRAAMTTSVAAQELRACAGTQFDPAIVSEFLQVIDASENVLAEVAEGKVCSHDNASMQEPVSETMASMKSLFQKMTVQVPHVHNIRYSRYILDSKNKIISVDDNFEIMTGYSREDIREKNLTQDDLIPPEDLTEYLCLTSEVLANNQIAYFEHRIKCKNGSMIYVFCMGKVFFDSAARETRSEIIIHDCSNTYAMRMMINDEAQKVVTQKSRWEDVYRKDSLTGVLNRSAFQSDVEEKLLDDNTKVMMLMVDVDEFKKFNDTHGHRAGDECLTFVATSIQGSLRGTDLACRMGGDEFAAALFFRKSCTNEFMQERARQIFDRIASVLKQAQNPVNISMGAAIADQKGMTFKQLYEASDKALYTSKESGRGVLSLS